jgi:Cys-tRNA(Pro) deacylase
MKTNVMRQLDAAAVNYEVKLHSRQVFTSEDAAEERGVRISQIVKTMLLRLGGGECIAALIPGDRQLDTKQLRQLVGQKNVAMLPRDEVQSVSGYVPGAVSPIGLRRVRRVIVDEHVLDEVPPLQVVRCGVTGATSPNATAADSPLRSSTRCARSPSSPCR